MQLISLYGSRLRFSQIDCSRDRIIEVVVHIATARDLSCTLYELLVCFSLRSLLGFHLRRDGFLRLRWYRRLLSIHGKFYSPIDEFIRENVSMAGILDLENLYRRRPLLPSNSPDAIANYRGFQDCFC